MQREHHRQSVRLPNVDYSLPGYYFVTMCTKDRECLFGGIVNGEMLLNEWGMIVKNEWLKTPSIRPNVVIDEFIVMPNHFHCIIQITDQINNHIRRGVLTYAPSQATQQSPFDTMIRDHGVYQYQGVYQYAPTNERVFRSPTQTIGAIVRGFKSAVTSGINIKRQTPGNPVWQRNYYEHIIRHDKSLQNIRAYIQGNPWHWDNDIENGKCRDKYPPTEYEKMLREHYNKLLS